MKFDVSGKGGLKKRFEVAHIDSSETTPGLPNLYYFDDRTELVFDDSRHLTMVNGETEEFITSDYIGGLLNQIETLNNSIKRVLRKENDAPSPNEPTLKPTRGILIHGFEGTGKSLILERLAFSKKCAVLRLEKDNLNAGIIDKNKEMIKRIFSDAKAKQPSLLLLEDVQEIASSNDALYAKTIAAEIGKLVDSRVVVIATCRSVLDLHTSIVGRRRLSKFVELPIPDQKSREEILMVTLKGMVDLEESRLLAEKISYATHGFTAKDLTQVIDIAENEALDHGDPSLFANECENALKEVRPTALREIFFESPQIRWDDIGGSEDIQKRFNMIIGWPLTYPELMKACSLEPTKGILLYGPPGCSKTLTAQAVAANYNLNFIPIKGAELISMYVGESERKVREIFQKARTAAPCVIFFDEVDAIASERESAGTKGLNVLTTLLNEMDGFDALRGVLVLAATNKPEALDPAIMRPGRFDSHFYLGPPDAVARKQILNLTMKDLRLHDEVDLDKFALDVEGYSGAEIVSICTVAKQRIMARAIENKLSSPSPINAADLYEGIDQTKKAITQEMLEAYKAFGEKAVSR